MEASNLKWQKKRKQAQMNKIIKVWQKNYKKKQKEQEQKEQDNEIEIIDEPVSENRSIGPRS